MTLHFLHVPDAPSRGVTQDNPDAVAKWILQYSAWSDEQIRHRIAELNRENDAESFMKWKWSPSLPALRRLGIRTRQEIDEEQYALRTLRGDFRGLDHMTKAKSALASAARYA